MLYQVNMAAQSAIDTIFWYPHKRYDAFLICQFFVAIVELEFSRRSKISRSGEGI